ncbi:class II aldolase/adducin family protein [Agrococcus sp. ARC_14]|uniref:class II aldolase/adducin family protein n=1 Tax=Agrococcus sp. ARC_14 TaxID=2919927 RepID=UPI001F059D57|nr:class II aldolase/adducin family protein [Agrococcus sp. ARC_14]MCH1881471.1 class II aldolase/adducin family protein [Agrococcus sp. ARC_14]
MSAADAQQARDALLALCHALGEPHRELAILGEGNVSVALGGADASPDDSATASADTSADRGARMLVKASGSTLGSAGADDLVECELAPILAVLDAPVADGHGTDGHGTDGLDADDAVTAALMASRVDPQAKRPSVEALLHAVVLSAGAGAACHTHPVAANGILCSDRAELIAAGALFPDHVVVLGQHALFVPYLDPGLQLALHMRDALRAFAEEHGRLPKIAYLQNHGIFAIGDDPAECLRITEMADKHARILTAALAIGEPAFLDEAVLDRIENRADEHHRRRVLQGKR